MTCENYFGLTLILCEMGVGAIFISTLALYRPPEPQNILPNPNRSFSPLYKLHTAAGLRWLVFHSRP
jgi:hypothetical protein